VIAGIMLVSAVIPFIVRPPLSQQEAATTETATDPPHLNRADHVARIRRGGRRLDRRGHHRGACGRSAVPQAAGRVLAEPVRAPFPLPRFDNAAMDGYGSAPPMWPPPPWAGRRCGCDDHPGSRSC
jgi:hypothetical protein